MIRDKLSRLVEPRTILMGTAIALVATLFAFVLAFFGFGNLYYASVFMPFFMLACLAVAWFILLRRDGFAGRPSESGLVPGLGGRHDPAVPSSAEPLAPLFAPRDDGIVPRAPRPPASRPAARRPVAVSAVLVWAAIELGLLAAILYSATGIGSRFYN
ncbi:MAG TPA: hypothetical protein VMX33_14720 [bacterium]|nr:hypothetical protein [bacterium]